MSGLWSFRRKNQEQTLDSVLTALPTASIPVIGSKTLFDVQQDEEEQKQQQQQPAFQKSSSSSPPNHPLLLSSALQDTEENQNAIDPDWAILRNKWMNEDFYNKHEYYHNEDDNEDDSETNNEQQEEENPKQVVGNKWLYQISPEKNHKQSESPSPLPGSTKTTNAQQEKEEKTDDRGRSLSYSLDQRNYNNNKSKESTSPQPSSSSIQGDIIDYKTLLSRIERQVMTETRDSFSSSSPPPDSEIYIEHKTKPKVQQEPSFSPPPRLSPPSQKQQQQLFTVVQTNPISSSYVTAVPIFSNHDVHYNKNNTTSTIYSTNPTAAALARASQSLRRTSANLEEIVHEQQESAKKQQKQKQKTADYLAKTSQVIPPGTRSVVATRLMFPSSSATTTTTTTKSNNRPPSSSKQSSISRAPSSSSAASSSIRSEQHEAPMINVEKVVKKSQQATRSASSLIKKTAEIQKPSSRAEMHKQVSSRFADPNSKEFKLMLEKELELIEAEKKLKEMEQQEKNTKNNNKKPPISNNNNNKKTSNVAVSSSPPGIRPVSRGPASRTATTTTAAAVSVNQHQQQQQQQQPVAFVERMMQRTKEREESRKQLVQKHQEEKQAKIQREIQEAEEDAKKNVAERTRAAKLREKMQRKMKGEEERKIKIKQLEDGREQLGELMNRRHFLGHVAFYPWRRLVQEKNRRADLLNDHQLLRQGFQRLKMNVYFEQRLRKTLFVSRCVGLSRLLRRWMMRVVLLKLKKNVVDSKRDLRDAKILHLKFCLRKWKRKALKNRVVSLQAKELWTEEKCEEAEEFRNKMQLRSAFRKWNQKLVKRNELREREKIRNKMWSIAKSVLNN